MHKDCFGDFRLDKVECDMCEQNVDCFVRAFNKLSCFSLALVEGFCNVPSHECHGEIVRCGSVRFILDGMRKNECFSRVNQTSDKCLLCKDVRNCEIAQAIRANISLSVEQVNESIKAQLGEMGSLFDTCFRKYEFDEECHKNCDFLIQCRKESKVVPGVGCAYWDAKTEKDYENEIPCSHVTYDKCLSSLTCKKILALIHEENKTIDDKMKIYKGFLSLDAIRDATEVGDGK